MDQRRRPKFRRRKPLPPSPEAPSEGAGPRVPAYGKGRRPAPAGARGLPKPTHWGDVAEWYDGLVGEHGDEYQQKVVLPGVLRLLSVGAGDRVLDVACGQGVLSRLLHARGVSVTGVDAAEKLIELARQRCDPSIRFIVADARNLVSLPTISEAHFTAAACVLAIQNIDPIAPVFEGVARALQPGGRFVLAMMHPAFRAPKSAHWGWDEKARVQYRRIDRYLTPRREPIITHPGKDPTGRTWTFHRPIQAYVRALANAGLLVSALEEWPSHKLSTSGPRAPAENVARREIPMFLALRAIKATPK